MRPIGRIFAAAAVGSMALGLGCLHDLNGLLLVLLRRQAQRVLRLRQG